MLEWLLSAGTRRAASCESGATSIEYGLIAAFMAIALITAMLLFGDNMALLFGDTSTKVDAAVASVLNPED